jgi:hypothetical protein
VLVSERRVGLEESLGRSYGAVVGSVVACLSTFFRFRFHKNQFSGPVVVTCEHTYGLPRTGTAQAMCQLQGASCGESPAVRSHDVTGQLQGASCGESPAVRSHNVTGLCQCEHVYFGRTFL